MRLTGDFMQKQIHNFVANERLIPVFFPLLSDGIYQVKRKSDYPFMEHYGVVVSGRFLKNFGFSSYRTKVIHKTNVGVFADDYNYSDWQIIKKIPENQIPLAIMRARVSIDNVYDLLIDNCEHFARFVTEGKKQSSQVQNFVVLGGIALTLILLRD